MTGDVAEEAIRPTVPLRAPLVSVVIPCFNYSTYLATAIDSALEQTIAPAEVIVVDDGSTDETPAVARGYGQVVRYLYRTNGGLPAARNSGLGVASGSHLVFLDADDALDPRYIEACWDALRDAPASCAYAYTQVQYFGEESGTSSFPAFDLELLKERNFVHASALVRADVVRRFGFCEELRAGWEDWDLWLTLAERGWTGVLVDEPLLRYRKHAGSMIDEHRRGGAVRLKARAQIMRRHRRLFGTWPWLRAEARKYRHLAANRVRSAFR